MAYSHIYEGVFCVCCTLLTHHEVGKDLLNENHERQQKEARIQLTEIIEVLKVCGIYRLPLRGDKDYGAFKSTENYSKQEGVFRGLLKLRGEAYPGIKLLKTAPLNAQYISPVIQNQLLDIMAKLVMKNVIGEVKMAKCFTILADETSTHSKEFLSVCIRTTGEALCDYILDILLEYGIDGKKMVAQGYDGASNMSGHIKGTRARIQLIYPQAEYYHCVNHKLNLAMEDSNENVVMKRAMQKFHDITVYLRSPTKSFNISRTMQR
uniref:DUF4371 domain-containing protein n=1 Tax=Panagrolaimus superbus TaxID=310955 RepID=A0A914YHN4_9BILA